MSLERFSREFSRRPRVLHCASRVTTPSARAVTVVVEDFMRTGGTVSRSGLEADIAACWCVYQDVPFQVGWASVYQAWVVRAATVEDVERMV